jgi:hypothetical protein
LHDYDAAAIKIVPLILQSRKLNKAKNEFLLNFILKKKLPINSGILLNISFDHDLNHL